MRGTLPDSEWDFRQIPDEQIFACYWWEFSRTAVLKADPDYVHGGLNPYAKYGEFAAPWPRQCFVTLDRKYRETLAANYRMAGGMYPLDYRHYVKNHDGVTSDSLYAFQIDWTHSDKNLRNCFEGWLKQNRPPDIQQQEARGRNAPLSQMKENLEALGIYRIIAHHGATPISQLIPLYADNLADRFKNDAAWSRSKARAVEALKSFR
jgi:hypothetical protein